MKEMNTTPQEQFNLYLQNNLPSRKDEAWKFTSLAAFKESNWTVTESLEDHDNGLTHDELKKISLSLPSDFYNLVFIDGVLNTTLSDDLDDQLIITQNPSVESLKDVSSSKNVDFQMIELAEMFARNKVQFSVKENQTLEKPIQFLFVQSGKKATYCSQNLFFQANKNSESSVIVQSVSLSDSQATASNLFLIIDCEDDARLKIAQIQNENKSSIHFSQTNIKTKSKSQVLHLDISLGGALVRNYLETNFVGHHSRVECYGIAALGTKQHVDNYTLIDHQKGENQSVQIYKSILAEEARSVFRGRVRIEPNAQKANSEQLNNNLLLSQKAHADSVPQLEIYADDVKAGHGSTVGQLNADEIFYFLSRGIGRTKAIKMLAEGYAQELIYKFENPTVVNWLKKSLAKKLEEIVSNV